MNPTRYAITDSAGLLAVGLPAYMLGTWDHYATSADGWVRLARVSGKGRAFASLSLSDWTEGVKRGLCKAEWGTT
jgi:hypothetical protein